jgi:biopolymer transport protein ExbB
MFIHTQQLMLSQTDIETAAQTFYEKFFIAGGAIVWFILLPMSIAAIYLVIDLAVTTRRRRLLPGGVCTEIATQAARYGLKSLAVKLAGRPDFISRAMLRATDPARSGDGSAAAIKQYAAESLQEQGLQFLRKVQWCLLIGQVAPMVGLFGTVYGMICAFNQLGQGSEGPRYEMLADSISVALVTTFWGLLIAIPAQFFYGVFQARIESFVSEAAMELEALLGRLVENGKAEIKPQPETPTAAKPAATGDSSPAAAKLVRQGSFMRRKQRRLGVIVQRPMVKRRVDEE